LTRMPSGVPSTKALINPVFIALHNLGGTATNAAMYSAVLEQLGLEGVAKLHYGDRDRDALSYRLAWARTQLKAHGLITNPRPAVWELTEKGRSQKEVDASMIDQPVGGEKQVNFRLPPTTIQMLENICEQLNLTRSVFIDGAIRAFAQDSEMRGSEDELGL
jgi:hypothetical protein